MHGPIAMSDLTPEQREQVLGCIRDGKEIRVNGVTGATTCGPLYQSGLDQFTGMDPEKVPIFAAGFVSGQAEKIYLGACSAAMFRPSPEWHHTVLLIAASVADRYGLRLEQLPTSRGVEIWLCRSRDIAEVVIGLPLLDENSRAWHQERGRLCGIPVWDIDPEFHKRSGFGEPCDRPSDK